MLKERVKIHHDSSMEYHSVPSLESSLTLNGHRHYFEVKEDNNVIYVPALAKIEGLTTAPGFIDLGIEKDAFVINEKVLKKKKY